VKAPRRHEKETAQSLKGRRVVASGALPGRPGDVDEVAAGWIDFLVECKTSEDASITVPVSWLNKITTEAGPARAPAIALRFSREALVAAAKARTAAQMGKPPTLAAEADWVLVPRSVFRRMQEAMGLAQSDCAEEP